MKMKKTISLTVLSLGVCALALAADYAAPDVGFKAVAPSANVTKAAPFSEDHKVEGAVTTDRQIASEKEASEREPSSLVAAKKKVKVEEDKKAEDKFEPKPWLYRNKNDVNY